MEINSSSLKKTARLAGLLYLILVITGVYGIMYIPSQIFVAGDSVSTAKNMLSNELLFGTGILNDIISNTIFLFLVLILYRLFKHVNENQAKLMFALVIVQIPCCFFYGGIQYYFPYDFKRRNIENIRTKSETRFGNAIS